MELLPPKTRRTSDGGTNGRLYTSPSRSDSSAGIRVDHTKQRVADLAKSFSASVAHLADEDKKQLIQHLSTKEGVDLNRSIDQWLVPVSEEDEHGKIEEEHLVSKWAWLHDDLDYHSIMGATAIMSGIINALLVIGFNTVKATLIFGVSEVTYPVVPLGALLFHFCSIVSGIGSLFWSDCKIGIAGPNIKFALLFGPTIATTLVADMEPLGDDDATISTIMFALAFSTLTFGICWFLLGQLKLTRVVQYMPTFVISGFIASVGYMIMMKAIYVGTGYHVSLEVTHFAMYAFGKADFWMLFVPGFFLGLLMYFMKFYHIGHPLVVLPVLILVPLCLFFACLYGAGYTIDDTRGEHGWFYSEFKKAEFYDQFLIISWEKVDVGMVFQRWLDLFVLLVILTVDALLKLVGIRQMMEIDLNYDKEMRLAGMYNLVNAVCFSVPGYTLLKFTSVNHGIIHNVKDRLPGIVCTLMMIVAYLSGLPLINFLPRFFLCALVVYAGFGFLWENLVLTYGVLPRMEYITVWIIMLITALSQLLYAVLVGVGLSFIIFVYKYGRRSAIRAVLTGSTYQSRVVRAYREQIKLQHLGKLFTLLELHRYLFFGSIIRVQQWVQEFLADRTNMNLATRQKFLLIDFSAVEGIDITGVMVFLEIAKACSKAGLPLIFTGMSEKDHKKFRILPQLMELVKTFDNRDSGAEYVEERMLAESAVVRRRWLIFKPLQVFHAQYVLRAKYEAMEELLGGNLGERVWLYTQTEEVEAGAMLCRAGEQNDKLYVLQRGRLSSYMELANGERTRLHTMTRGACVNEDSLFLDMPTSHTMIADERSVVISITRQAWRRLEADDPMVALQIQRIVMLHGATIRKTLEQEVDALDRWEDLSSRRNNQSKSSELGKKNRLKRDDMAKERMSLLKDNIPQTPNRSGRRGSLVRLKESGAHHFHHLGHNALPQYRKVSMAELNDNESALLANLNIHMSESMTQLAQRCYHYHHAKGLGVSRVDMERQKMDELNEEHHGANWPDKEVAMEPLELEDDAEGTHFPDSEVRKALMDLGKFPSETDFCKVMARSRQRIQCKTSEGCSMVLFMEVVKRFDLAKLPEKDVVYFMRKFLKHARMVPIEGQDTPVLDAMELGLLMQELGRYEEPLELNRMVKEWALNNEGYIDLNNFLSMMSHFVKLEELDEQVEDIFCRFAREHKEHVRSAVQAEDTITASDILRVMKQQNVRCTLAEAEEMVADADSGNSGNVDFEEFRAAILMVSEAELQLLDDHIIPDGTKAKRISRSADDDEGGPAKRLLSREGYLSSSPRSKSFSDKKSPVLGRVSPRGSPVRLSFSGDEEPPPSPLPQLNL